jgi:murein L,D-transpeptidase YcbB/YkuD
VVVNIPAATAQLMLDGRVALTSRVIVGRRHSPTPLLESAIDDITLNPYWNVPTSIARNEILPKVAVQPAYLAANHMRVLSGPNGAAAIPLSSVDWAHFFQRGYRLRQDPGSDNPLGQIKFGFPNPYSVYLHDTPSRLLFLRPDRALSHGCIRVERAFDLAVRLLAGSSGWTAESLRAAIDTGHTQTVNLARPVPIRTVYITAWVADDGTVQFRPDIYGRDAAAAAGRPKAKASLVSACGIAPSPSADEDATTPARG